jgi:acetyl esterase/lipase
MPLDANALTAARALVAELAGQTASASRPGVDRREIHIDADSGRRVRLLHFRVPDSPGSRPAMLHFHPGGFVLGSPEMCIEPIEEIVAALGCDVFSVDYPLAPEARFPDAFTAGMAALRWMRSNSTNLGIDPARIALIGESAGGGLAASVGLGTREFAGPPLCGLVLLFPMLDDRSAIGEPHPFAGEFVWTRDKNHFGWSALLGHPPGHEGISPFAAPARATDLAGMPPTFISTGSIDLFIDDNIAFAQRLIRAGVPVEMHVHPGAPHAFERVGEARATRAMKRDRIAAVARMFGSDLSAAGERA